MSYNERDLNRLFWFAIFAVILIALVFSLVERSRLTSVILVTFLAITFALSRIGGKKHDKKKRTNK
jgi:uncharacterized MnhB-related membrane protein